jgi:hypothetical protein
MSEPTCLLRCVQQSVGKPPIPLLRVSGRIDERGGRIAKAVLHPEAIVVASTQHATVAVDLKAIPMRAPWPRSKNHDAICAMLGRVGLEEDDVGPYPYPEVDCESIYFIPSEAVVCRLTKGEGEEVVQCEGYYDCERDALRLDAVDMDRHHWFWMAVEVAAWDVNE